eukprot:6657094-Karenia_brevis.AAC.1
MKCWPSIDGTRTERHLEFNRCIRQGGCEAPWIWNGTMRMVLNDLVPKWEQEQLGFHVEGFGFITHALWADNIYLISGSPANIAKMAEQLTERMQQEGLHWKPGSITYIGTNVAA